MYNFDVFTNENDAEHNLKWPYIPDHPYRILIFGGSGSGKANALLNLIEEQNSDLLTAIDKIYLYDKVLNEQKYQTLTKKCEKAGIKHLDKSNPNAFIEYSNTMDDVYNNINGYDTLRKRKMLIMPDHMISHINTNKKFQVIFK